ncbi:hypothetical protein [Devosia nitrariae]|uniref:DUF4064 domain-containing protein n=1 Tax=Devosia nitrariae TaxID=2071872 RepID=A0ABQ5WA09_9HYPH|nr:hypothetical protein [Devosia nitrariae]GLQ56621.1 hypothetical protein GCM10010862_38800 [Devosia nitrariae]
MRGSLAKGAGASFVLLAAAGVLVAGIGVYFMLLRPSFLPEDLRFMQLTSEELALITPRLQNWLDHVFLVLGGYALATGILTLALAATSFRRRHLVAVVAAIVGGISSIGLMSAVNFAIDSDFKWLLLSFALVWALSFVAYGIEGQRGPFVTRPAKEPRK